MVEKIWGRRFGVVNKGVLRGNVVTIKMKDVESSDELSVESQPQIEAHNMFQCNYLVHFYGAHFIPNHIMIITEYAPGRSIAEHHVTARARRKAQANAWHTRIGMQHVNDFLLRDFKPGNASVFSGDALIAVNGKTDGLERSRNINTLMTNMTFTQQRHGTVARADV